VIGRTGQESPRARAAGGPSRPHGARCAAALTFDFDAESVRIEADAANAGRPGAETHSDRVQEIVELPVQWLLDDAAHWWFGPGEWVKKISTAAEVRSIWSFDDVAIGTCDEIARSVP
jgi:hypothetical protein